MPRKLPYLLVSRAKGTPKRDFMYIVNLKAVQAIFEDSRIWKRWLTSLCRRLKASPKAG